MAQQLQHLVLFQRTQIWFKTHISGDAPQPSGSRGLMPSSGLHGYLHSCVNPHNDPHTHLIKHFTGKKSLKVRLSASYNPYFKLHNFEESNFPYGL